MKARYNTTVTLGEEEKNIFDELGVKAIDVFRAGLEVLSGPRKANFPNPPKIFKASELVNEIDAKATCYKCHKACIPYKQKEVQISKDKYRTVYICQDCFLEEDS